MKHHSNCFKLVEASLKKHSNKIGITYEEDMSIGNGYSRDVYTITYLDDPYSDSYLFIEELYDHYAKIAFSYHVITKTESELDNLCMACMNYGMDHKKPPNGNYIIVADSTPPVEYALMQEAFTIKKSPLLFPKIVLAIKIERCFKNFYSAVTTIMENASKLNH